MKFIKVYNEVSGALGGEVAFRVDSEARVITFVGEEWGGACCCAGRVVVGELGKWE